VVAYLKTTTKSILKNELFAKDIIKALEFKDKAVEMPGKITNFMKKVYLGANMAINTRKAADS